MRRISALLAIFALALNALWPLLAQARPRDASLVGYVCSSEGSHAIDLSEQLPGPGSDKPEHCKLCPVGAAAVLPGFASSPRAPAPVVDRAGSFAEIQIHKLSASPAPSRGPPSIL